MATTTTDIIQSGHIFSLRHREQKKHIGNASLSTSHDPDKEKGFASGKMGKVQLTCPWTRWLLISGLVNKNTAAPLDLSLGLSVIVVTFARRRRNWADHILHVLLIQNHSIRKVYVLENLKGLAAPAQPCRGLESELRSEDQKLVLVGINSDNSKHLQQFFTASSAARLCPHKPLCKHNLIHYEWETCLLLVLCFSTTKVSGKNKIFTLLMPPVI